MKKLLILLLVLLFPPSLYAVCPVVTEGGEEHHLCDRIYDGDVLFNGAVSIPGGVADPSMVKQTTADLNLYVRTTGDDSHDCLSAGAACLTIQEAVDRVPKHIRHDVVVDIGEGTFTYLTVAGFTVEKGSLTVQGTLNNPTLTTGTTSGTADGGSTTQCIDSGQTWTADELIGKLILVNGEYRVPYDNNGTTIDFRCPLAGTCNGKAYELVEQKTVLTGTDPLIGYGRVAIANNRDRGYNIFIFNLKVTGYCTAGFVVISNQGSNIERCYSDGAYFGFFSEECNGYSRYFHCYSINNAGAGFTTTRDSVRSTFKGCVVNACGTGYSTSYMTGYTYLVYNVALNCTIGLNLESSWLTYVTTGLVDGSSEFGIKTHHGKSVHNAPGSSGRLSVQNMIISNNTLGGISVGKGSFCMLEDVTGTGNGAYGVEVFSGSYVMIDSGTTVTGTSGDATINDGATTLTWATDFNDNGDIATNLDSGCRIERRD